MGLKWESPIYVKVHEDCGGRIRWVEAIDTMGVGYTGECRLCGAEGVVVEEIIPVRTRGTTSGFGAEFDIFEDVRGADRETLAGMGWDDDADFDENQERLREELLGEGVSV